VARRSNSQWFLTAGLAVAFAMPQALAQTTAPAGLNDLSTYGTPGLIDLPTADVLPDGNIALTTSGFGSTLRNTLTFQLLPNLYGTFRYSVIRDFDPGGPQDGDRFDRSFDVHYQIWEEAPRRPAVALGLRDFGGTGIYSSEYVVATKTVTPGLRATAGLGWGRLAERGSFTNPLSILGNEFKTRPNTGAGGLNTTGQPDVDAWFRGDAAAFAGLQWQASERLTFALELSPDSYSREASVDTIAIDTPVNLGLTYRFANGGQLRGYTVGGTEIGLQYSYILDPAKRPVPGGAEPAPAAFVPRSASVFARADLNDGDVAADVAMRIAEDLADEGLILEAIDLTPRVASITVENQRYDAEAQALGRAMAVLGSTLPISVETFSVTFSQGGMSISTVQLARSDFETLSQDYDGAWKSLARAKITDAPTRPIPRPGSYPRLDYGLAPYTTFSFFDPDQPLRADAGLRAFGEVRAAPGLSFRTVLLQPLVGNIADATRQSNSVIERVRSDAVIYAQESDLEINQLTTQYLWRPGADLFGRATLGYLETMYAGLSSEVLWSPMESRLALGAELNYVKQREFDGLFGLRDYDVVTGHASAYYDLGNGFLTQVDVGRYLAGDWGATVALDREFNNGFKVGAYFTLTDVPFEDFGEGSFDKGIRLEVPLSWFSGRPSRDKVTQVIQPVLRDGGARLNVDGRLYGVTRDYRSQELSDTWGRVYR